MNKEDLYIELGNIDSNYIEEADEPVIKVSPLKRFAPLAAVFVLLIGALSMSDSVQAAIKRLFAFIPGIAIEEQTGSGSSYSGLLYSMDGEPETKTNGKITVMLQNAYVGTNNVDIVYKVILDFFDEEFLTGTADDNEIMQDILDENDIDYIEVDTGHSAESLSIGSQYKINSTVNIAGADYTPDAYYGGGSRKEITYTARISSIPNIIEEYGEFLPIILTIGGLSFDIKLKPIETYETVDEIGPTILKNNISLTAVPIWEGDTLYIKMYSLNYSEFSQVYGYIYYSYDGEGNDLLPYLTIGGQNIPASYDGGDGTEFYFDLSEYGFSDEEKSSAVYHVPCVEVLDSESAVIEFTVNDDGTIDFPNKISLKYADIDITAMMPGTKIDSTLANVSGWENSIGIKFTVAAKQNNISLSDINFDNINGRKAGGGSTSEYKGNNWTVIFLDNSIDKLTDYHSVTLSTPAYIIEDEYVFTVG